MSKNDDKIIGMKEEILKKKKELSKGSVKVTTITNCSLNIVDKRYNINTLKGQELQHLLVSVNMLFLSAKDLKMQDDFKYDGYLLGDWISDLKSRVAVEEYKKKVKEMTALEKQLDSLLSSDKQTELEIDGISELINNL
jgi:hypothetical protein